MPRLILASTSPRRQQLLREAGYDFLVHPADIDEERLTASHMLPAEIARRLAFEKAKAVADHFAHDVILAADTVVAFADKPLGKPADADDARRMLNLLSGTTHVVITGVAVLSPSTGLSLNRSAMSAVRMRTLTPAEIDDYIASDQWRGKAGAYGIQDNDPFVTNMAGSLTNIVGLPMETTTDLLAQAGIFPTIQHEGVPHAQ